MEEKLDTGALENVQWVNPSLPLEDARFVTVGVDVGSIFSKAVLAADGEVLSYACVRQGALNPESSHLVLSKALEAAGLGAERIHCCVGTGYGRINIPFADRTLTEIACHARGANYLYGPELRTVLDIGGQDIKAILCDEKGKVLNFILSDKCASGTGRGFELFSRLLGVPVGEIGSVPLVATPDLPSMKNNCVFFAGNEASSLLARGKSAQEILSAYFEAAADRLHALLKKLGVVPRFGLTGGCAKNDNLMERLHRALNIERMRPRFDPQIAGALGGALFAYSLCLKGKAGKQRRTA